MSFYGFISRRLAPSAITSARRGLGLLIMVSDDTSVLLFQSEVRDSVHQHKVEQQMACVLVKCWENDQLNNMLASETAYEQIVIW